MKRIFLTIICAVMFLLADAQIARWLVEPNYEDIHLVNGIDAVVADSCGAKVLWSFNGKRLALTKDDLYDFNENRCVTLKPGSQDIAGVIKDNGEIYKLNNCIITNAYPYYSCGKLLVKDGAFHRFVDNEGKKSVGKYSRALPYFNHFASCHAFKNIQKLKDPYLLLVDENEESVIFSYGDKTFDADDLEFISSVNDENIAIVVIKHKLYYFNGVDKTLAPVFAIADDNNIKNQAKLDGGIKESLTKIEGDTIVLSAVSGKKNMVSFAFDKMMKPVSFSVNDSVNRVFTAKEEYKREINSPLCYVENGNLYGLNWGAKEILPPQFDKLSTCFGNRAFVVLNGKYGMLEVNEDDAFGLRINKGNDIAFLHQKFETTIRADLPTYILSDRAFIEVVNDTCGIELDKTSRKKKNTESGNFVEYNCVLSIPESLGDEMEEVTYPVQIVYDDLKSPIIKHKVNAWFYKKYEIEEDDEQRSVSQGTLTFVFNVKNAQQDGTIVKFDVSVTADSLETIREEKMSETRYKYKVKGLNEGINNVVVQVLEQGCPPASFPFEVEYHKAVAKTAKKENVVIKRKQYIAKPQSTKTTSTPRLEI